MYFLLYVPKPEQFNEAWWMTPLVYDVTHQSQSL